MIKEAIGKVVMGNDLSEDEMIRAMDEIMSGNATPAQIGSFITALRMKGETVDEVSGAAKVMREKAQKIMLNSGDKTVLDIVGTGGDGAKTFNVSTAASFLAAGAGLTVAKHGNRAVSSSCGAADVLENLGVKLDISHSDVERCINEVGIGFLFAPVFHGAMKHAAGPRKEVGLRTIFNMLGPLTNPALANIELMGVYDPSLTEMMAKVLGRLGTREAFVVHGEGNLDEISICGKTRVSHLKDGDVKTFEIAPEDFGIERASIETIRGGSSEKNAEIIRNILKGEKGPKRDMVLLNSAAAFVAAGMDKEIGEGVKRAEEVIDSGKAMEKLEALVKFTQACI